MCRVFLFFSSCFFTVNPKGAGVADVRVAIEFGRSDESLERDVRTHVVRLVATERGNAEAVLVLTVLCCCRCLFRGLDVQ